MSKVYFRQYPIDMGNQLKYKIHVVSKIHVVHKWISDNQTSKNEMSLHEKIRSYNSKQHLR